MFHFLLISLFPLFSAFASERLVVFGGDEVFQIDAAAEAPTKLWSWRAEDRAEIPADLRKSFATTDECKPVADGSLLLVCSSGGGCALLQMPAGKATWWARVPNAHSIEALPGGMIAVAASTAASGRKMALFNRRKPGEIVSEIPLHSAHGLVLDGGSGNRWFSARIPTWRIARKPSPSIFTRNPAAS